MYIFNRKTKQKHIEQLEFKIANLLQEDLPQLKKVIGMSKVYGIDFMHKPAGIYVARGYKPDAYNEIMRHHRTHFNLKGILILNQKTKEYYPLQLNYLYDSLTRIEVENPYSFHRLYDLDSIKIGKIQLEHLPLVNPDIEIAEKALKSLTKEQKDLMELEDTFEIEIKGKSYYTILDMEDGNYIAVDENGRIYRLNHDHTEQIRKIADKPVDFLKLYSGQKSDLEKIMLE
ncbi:hypothetical protein HUW51_23760 [Adhaeribacter swui]|uniref:Uncharacterized protein n=1 Tax=Adhaeribacter swui TaxID=2086471 RepID=A0A7G7GEJ1_9BACT|nr:hypothetical protein [Adhaeribacter swui]QNF35575.1 hypothetical protein HUW51_23760 [Adhaeribacter swui]